MKKLFCFMNILFIIPIITIVFTAAQAQVTGEKYYNKAFYEDFGGPLDNQIWQVLGGNEHGGDLSSERCYVENGLLNMIFINDPAKGYLSSAIQTRNEFLYGRWEASLKPTDVPGVLNSFYTIDWNNTADETSESNGTKQEIDIEFLSKSFKDKTGEVHLAVHESGKKSFDTNPDIKLDFNPSANFHVWGFEVTPEYIEWFVEGKVLHRYNYAENDITINAPYMLKLNFWSSEKWIGGPPEENVVCVYQIDWIKFTPLHLLRD
jgi:beta-glucanase (GH16 family)